MARKRRAGMQMVKMTLVVPSNDPLYFMCMDVTLYTFKSIPHEKSR